MQNVKIKITIQNSKFYILHCYFTFQVSRKLFSFLDNDF